MLFIHVPIVPSDQKKRITDYSRVYSKSGSDVLENFLSADDKIG